MWRQGNAGEPASARIIRKSPGKTNFPACRYRATVPRRIQPGTLMEDFNPHHILCYDSEFVREHSYIPKLALVQTCRPGGSAHLYDPLDGADAVPWQAILHHPAPIVLHAGAQDLELMQLCGGGLPQTVRDTQIGFALCSPQLAVSYAQLVEHYLGISPDKSQTRSDWLARPLNAEQRAYAAADVELLARLYPYLVADLRRLGRLDWWAEENAALLARQTRPREAWHWYRLQGAPQLRAGDRRVAEILTAARERLAAAQDLPRRAIMSDRQLIAIAQKQPPTLEALAEHLSASHPLWQELPYLSGQFAADAAPPAQPSSPRFGHARRQQYEKLCRSVADTAAALGIHPDLLATTRALKHYCAEPSADSPLLRGWRAAYLREELQKLL